MKEGYKINETIGSGLFIEVYNWCSLNEVSHFRWRFEPKKISLNRVGMWKQKIK